MERTSWRQVFLKDIQTAIPAREKSATTEKAAAAHTNKHFWAMLPAFSSHSLFSCNTLPVDENRKGVVFERPSGWLAN